MDKSKVEQQKLQEELESRVRKMFLQRVYSKISELVNQTSLEKLSFGHYFDRALSLNISSEEAVSFYLYAIIRLKQNNIMKPEEFTRFEQECRSKIIENHPLAKCLLSN